MSRPGSAGGPPAAEYLLTDLGWHDRGYLPHFDGGGIAQLVTYRLADALPRHVARALAAENCGDVDRRRYIESMLDAGHGARLLRRPDIAEIVASNWRYFDGKRYHLHAWVIMPNHVHVLVEIYARQSLARIVHSWKSYTAKEIQRRTPIAGRVWQPEYWDRFIRNQRHFLAAVSYIRENPVKARLVRCAADWPWSSAFDSAGGPPALPGR